ncbi:MAG TPA: PIG-L family deacetylase [Acidobacteriota bacterium]|nr:PIG-L family deacetylase [Acidobacteriota bacterium]
MRSLLSCLLLLTAAAGGGSPQTTSSKLTLLAVGAHAGDMEVASGAVLAKHARSGNRVVLLHLTLGEGGNPRLTPEEYGRQKRREAEAAAKAIGAEFIIGPYKDGELTNSDESRKFVADTIRQIQPAYIITHWKNSIHKDHAAAHVITTEAVLLASLAGVKSVYAPHRGVRSVWFTENWEDKDGFSPYVYFDVSDSLADWEKCVREYEFIRGGISSFPYFEYYKSLAKVRGAEGGLGLAVCFDVDSWSKKRILHSLP